MDKKTVVLFSGGQDSTTCLKWALNRFHEVYTLGFDYGQQHSVEMECRREILLAMTCPQLKRDFVFYTDILKSIGGSTLIDGGEITTLANGLPSSFVPGRNLFFLNCAAMLAYRLGADDIVTGVCQTDFSGYPDCRHNAIAAATVAINACMDANIVIHTPLMFLTKAQTWKLAMMEGGESLVELVRTKTHTCYNGDHTTLHDWGYGCGECPACKLREKGWREFVEAQ